MQILNGHPLIHWVLEEMIQSQGNLDRIYKTEITLILGSELTSVWVSTNDPEVKDYIVKNKPLVRVHDRPWYTATDDASSLIAVQEFLSFHPGNFQL